MDITNINQTEGAAVPTPQGDMSTQGSAPQADLQAEAKSPVVLFAEKALGREFASEEEAQKTLTNLNRMVGDQNIAKQRKALESIAQRANMTPEELVEYAATQDIDVPQAMEETPVESAPARPDMNTNRLVRVEIGAFVKDVPEAAAVKDRLFARVLASGKPAEEVWATEFAPLIEIGQKNGAKKLQKNLQEQPTQATSVASDTTDTTVDFRGVNPATNRRWTSEEMAKYLTHS